MGHFLTDHFENENMGDFAQQWFVNQRFCCNSEMSLAQVHQKAKGSKLTQYYKQLLSPFCLTRNYLLPIQNACSVVTLSLLFFEAAGVLPFGVLG